MPDNIFTTVSFVFINCTTLVTTLTGKMCFIVSFIAIYFYYFI